MKMHLIRKIKRILSEEEKTKQEKVGFFQYLREFGGN